MTEKEYEKNINSITETALGVRNNGFYPLKERLLAEILIELKLQNAYKLAEQTDMSTDSLTEIMEVLGKIEAGQYQI